MKVRDKTLPVDDYDGQWAEALNELCPCRKCYAIGEYQGMGMRCQTRDVSGCPHAKPTPIHIFTAHGKVCKRCGAYRSMVKAGR